MGKPSGRMQLHKGLLPLGHYDHKVFLEKQLSIGHCFPCSCFHNHGSTIHVKHWLK